MATPVIMPKFGMAQEEGTILRWHKAEGDHVRKGDVILEVMTDKVDMEVESLSDGILAGVRYGPDTTLPVTTVLAYLLAPGEELPADAAATASAAADVAATTSQSKAEPAAPAKSDVKASPVAQRVAADAGVDLRTVQGSGPGGRIQRADVEAALATVPAPAAQATSRTVRATPAARRVAREEGVDLATVAGTGPNARVQAADVHAFVAATPAATSEDVTTDVRTMAGTGMPLRGMRKTIATRLTQSWQSAPHVTFTSSIDMTQAEALRTRLRDEVEASGARFTPTILIAKAVAVALTRHPRLNAWLQEEGRDLMLTEHPHVNLGMAVALEDGLIVPVVKDAQTLGLAGLAQAVATLSQRARAGEMAPADVMDGTFTISNLGMFPVDHFTAIINPPQVAILAVGRTQVQPVWDGAAFQPTPVMQVTLSADHRAVDGAVAAAFLTELKRLLEEPTRMLV